MPAISNRAVALLIALAGTAFWIYTFFHIASLPVGDGTGFQWLGEVPLTMIFLFGTLPALIMAASGRALKAATGFGVVSLVLFALLWIELLQEFAH